MPEVVGTGDRGKAPITEPSQGVDSEDSIPPPPLVVAGVGTSGAGPSGASTSYIIPEVPRDIVYYDKARLMHYRIPDVPVEADRLGSLAGVSPDEVKYS